MKKVTFYGEVFHDGCAASITFPEKDDLAQIVWESLSGKVGAKLKVRLSISEDFESKDDKEIGYYFSVVVQDICREMNNLGSDWDAKRTHAELKRMFAPVVNGVPTTKRMSKREFHEYVYKCVHFANTFLQIEVRSRSSFGLSNFPDAEPPE